MQFFWISIQTNKKDLPKNNWLGHFWRDLVAYVLYVGDCCHFIWRLYFWMVSCSLFPFFDTIPPSSHRVFPHLLPCQSPCHVMSCHVKRQADLWTMTNEAHSAFVRIGYRVLKLSRIRSILKSIVEYQELSFRDTDAEGPAARDK